MNSKRKVRDLYRIYELRSSRPSLEHSLNQVLANISQKACFMHFILEKHNKDYVQISIYYYIVGLVSCWETYFRDMFLLIYEKDSDFSRQSSKYIEERNSIKKKDIVESIGNQVMYNEYLSTQISFQNLEIIENIFRLLFINHNFMDSIGEYIIPYIRGDKIYSLSLNKSLSEWKNVIHKIYKLRHRFIHDANLREKVDIELIRKAETIFTFLPQIFSHWVAEKYKLPRVTIHTDNGDFPAILTIKDLISEDWEIVN